MRGTEECGDREEEKGREMWELGTERKGERRKKREEWRSGRSERETERGREGDRQTHRKGGTQTRTDDRQRVEMICSGIMTLHSRS